MSKYDDIINLSRPISKRKKMSIEERAAQFSPFAALNGYEEAIEETGRYVDSRNILDEEAFVALDQELFKIRNKILERPLVHITYFLKDDKKIGGQYFSKNIIIKKIDDDHRLLITDDDSVIEMDDVYYMKMEENNF